MRLGYCELYDRVKDYIINNFQREKAAFADNGKFYNIVQMIYDYLDGVEDLTAVTMEDFYDFIAEYYADYELNVK